MQFPGVIDVQNNWKSPEQARGRRRGCWGCRSRSLVAQTHPWVAFWRVSSSSSSANSFPALWSELLTGREDARGRRQRVLVMSGANTCRWGGGRMESMCKRTNFLCVCAIPCWTVCDDTFPLRLLSSPGTSFSPYVNTELYLFSPVGVCGLWSQQPDGPVPHTYTHTGSPSQKHSWELQPSIFNLEQNTFVHSFTRCLFIATIISWNWSSS